ncbi:hypothetical protein OIO90_006456 [Microbotryomycetes sp. JL221]|nr:hypothetical protein OIO90_006456 [Microbotryomycetes sp. JL221]
MALSASAAAGTSSSSSRNQTRNRTRTAPGSFIQSTSPFSTNDMYNTTLAAQAAAEEDEGGWNDVRQALQAAERDASTTRTAAATTTTANLNALPPPQTVTRPTLPLTLLTTNSGVVGGDSSSTMSAAEGLQTPPPSYLTSPFPAAVSLPPHSFDPWSTTTTNNLSQTTDVKGSYHQNSSQRQEPNSNSFVPPALGVNLTRQTLTNNFGPPGTNLQSEGTNFSNLTRHQSLPSRRDGLEHVGLDSVQPYRTQSARMGNHDGNRMTSAGGGLVLNRGSGAVMEGKRMSQRFPPPPLQQQSNNTNHFTDHPSPYQPQDYRRPIPPLPPSNLEAPNSRRRVLSDGSDGLRSTATATTTTPSSTAFGSKGYSRAGSGQQNNFNSNTTHSLIENWYSNFSTIKPVQSNSVGSTMYSHNHNHVGVDGNLNQSYRTHGSPTLNNSNTLDPASLKPPVGLKLRSGLPERTTYAMWVGNIPTDSSEQELWSFFSTRPPLPKRPGGLGLQSIHLIARSQCAFLNLDSEDHLFHMITQSHGTMLRPNDNRCKPLVCRVRRTEDDAKSGVGAQRGGGLHKAWVKKNGIENDGLTNEVTPFDTDTDESMVARGVTSSLDTETRIQVGHELESERDSIESTGSGSTDSGFFSKHFPKRYFILKSHNQFDLEQSVKHGYWSTQPHNEPVLDQAFRTASEGVFIVFSANKSGSWFGVARMAGPIYPSPREGTPTSPISPDSVDSSLNKFGNNNTIVTSLSSNPSFHNSLTTSKVPPHALKTVSTETSPAARRPFRVKWLTCQTVPFIRTRHINNSFNSNREVKICRDGTEVEPIAGELLVQEVMRRGPTQSSHPSLVPHPPLVVN